MKIMENPIKMDDLVVPLFLETPNWTSFFKGDPTWSPSWRSLKPLKFNIVTQNSHIWKDIHFLNACFWFIYCLRLGIICYRIPPFRGTISTTIDFPTHHFGALQPLVFRKSSGKHGSEVARSRLEEADLTNRPKNPPNGGGLVREIPGYFREI